MSWSFQGVGRPPQVVAKMQSDLAQSKCAEPEETIKGAVLAIVRHALSSFPQDAAVIVECSGSQSGPGPTDVANALALRIQPLHGFLG